MGIFRRIKNVILFLMIGGGMGLVLMVFANIIPTDAMIRNARSSIDIFKVEGAYPQVIHGYQATTLDNYTDAWMLRNACYNGNESAWQKALHVYFYGYTNGEINDVCESTIAWLEGKEGYERMSYARYWHGYLIILKPLLYLWDYGDIREFFKFIEVFMLLYICVLLAKRQMTYFIPAFAVAMMCIEFSVIGMSLQYSWVFIIAMFFSIFILKRNSYSTKIQSAELLFLVIGMMTSYFDFLTYPIFTLGIPLLVLVTCERNEMKNDVTLLYTALMNSVYWAVGYIGMWVQKWILYNVLTGEDLIADGVQAFLFRSGQDVFGQQIGYLETVIENLKPLCKYPYVMLVLAAAIMIFFICKKSDKDTFSKWAIITYSYIAVLPFCWYAVTINHSYIHSFMTYRDFGVTICASLCIWIEIWRRKGHWISNRSTD